MQLDELLTNDALLGELGRRLERHRLQRNMTQPELAQEAGIGRATLQRIEAGASVQTTSLVKLLRALDLLAGLDAAVPAHVERPIAQLERERRGERKRARASQGSASPERETWAWGEQDG